MKKILILVSAFALVLALSACKPGTEPDPELVVTLAGLADQEITAGDAIDLMDGVTATGSDGVDYSDIINVDSDDCVVTAGAIDTSNPATCHITYTAVVEGKMVRETIVVTIKPIDVGPVDGPILKEWNWESDLDLEGWTQYVTGTGGVTASVDAGALKLEVTSDTLVYGARYEYMGLPFEDGQAYEISFKAKTDVAGKGIHFQVGELISNDPWFYDFKPGQVDDFGLTTEWAEYSFSFMYTKDLDSGFGGPLFEMGDIDNADAGVNSVGLDATIWLDDLVIKGGSGTDSLAPSIMGADDVTLFIEDAVTFDPAAGVTASDIVDGDLTADVVIAGDTVDPMTAGVYFVTYTVSDEAMNETVVTRTVTVMSDTEAPMLTGVEDAVYFLGDGKDELTGVMAMDNRDGDVTVDIVVTGDDFDELTAGTYSVIYTVTDAIGNEATVTREIQLLDVTFVDYTDNLVNPNFDYGYWNPYWEGWNGADAFVSAGDNGLTLDIKAVGSDFWHVLIEQGGIVLEANKTYRLTFDAMSSVARDIQVEVAGAGLTPPQETVSLTDTMTTYTVDFVVGDTATGGMLKFLMGLINDAPASVITLDNVMFEEWDGAAIVADTDQVMDGSFDEYQTTGWGAWSPNGNTSFMTQWSEAYLLYDEANANPWENKLEQTGIDMVSGLIYRVTFNAKGDAARDFIVGFWDGGTAFEKQFELGTDFQTYTWIFEYTGGDVAALEFKLGKSSDNFAGTLFVVDTIMIEVEDAVPEVPVPAWEDFGIAVAETETDVTLTYDEIPANWWEKNAQFKNLVFDATRTAVEFTFTGTAGHEYLFKIEGGGQFKEVPIVADGTEQTHVIDLSEFSADQRAGLNLFIFFVKTLDAQGTAVVSWDYFGDAVMLPEWNGYDTHTVVEGEGNAVEVTYAGINGDAWWNGNSQYSNFMFDGMYDAIEFTFTGTAGHEYLFKIEGGGQAKELGITADGMEQTLLIPLDEFTKEQRDAFNLLIFFVQTDAAAGTANLSWDYALTEGWHGFGMDVVRGTGDEMTATYDVTTEWWWDFSAQYLNFTFDGTNEAIDFTFTGEVGQTYLFKVERADGTAVEVGITADGTEQVLQIDVSGWTQAERDSIAKLVVFANAQSQAGSVTVSWGYGVLPV